MNRQILIIISSLFFTSIITTQGNDGYSSVGKEFYVAFPKNGFDYYQNPNLELYLSSVFDTEVLITNLINNQVYTFNLLANTTLTINHNLFGTFEDLEIDNIGITNKILRIESENDISVYVLASKYASSDGYLSIPTNLWGKTYIHNSYYDFTERNNFQTRRQGGGFVVFAKEDDTEITIDFKGINQNSSRINNQYAIGETITIVLNKGQAYTIKSLSELNRPQDISGTLINANKPVGVLSFHERTKIPTYDPNNGRDNLLSMIPSVNYWGKKYFSLEFQRENKGDFFRVLPLFDNTLLSYKSYDFSGNLIEENEIMINTGGRFFEYNNSFINGANTNNLTGIRGVTIWESDKPIMVSQYSYSASWDLQIPTTELTPYDPFMLNLISDEQFVKKAIFQVPTIEDFRDNYLNIFVKIDSNQDLQSQLNTILFDGNPLNNFVTNFSDNNIPNTNIYYASINIDKGSHLLEGDIEFCAYVYGFGNVDSYGWPAAIGFNNIIGNYFFESLSDNCDTIKKSVYLSDTYEVENTISLNIKDITVIENQNFDVIIDIIEPDYAEIIASPIMKAIDAKAIIKVTNDFDKEFFDTIYYYSDYIYTTEFSTPDLDTLYPGTGFTLDVNLAINDHNHIEILDTLEFRMTFNRFDFEILDISENDNFNYDIELNTIGDNYQVYIKMVKNKLDFDNGSNLVSINLKSFLSMNLVLKYHLEIINSNLSLCKFKKYYENELNLYDCIIENRLIEISDSFKSSIQEDYLYVNTNNYNFEITDLNGKVVRIIKSRNQSYNLKSLNLPIGVYFINIKKGNQSNLLQYIVL